MILEGDPADGAAEAEAALKRFHAAAREARERIRAEECHEAEQELDAALARASTMEQLEHTVAKANPQYQEALTAYRRASLCASGPIDRAPVLIAHHRARILLPGLQRRWDELTKAVRLNDGDQFLLPEIEALESLARAAGAAGPATPSWLVDALSSYKNKPANVPEREIVRLFRSLLAQHPRL